MPPRGVLLEPVRPGASFAGPFIVLPPAIYHVLPIALIRPEILTARVLHPKILLGQRPYPPRLRKLGDPYLEPFLLALSPGLLCFEPGRLTAKLGRHRVQVNTSQH